MPKKLKNKKSHAFIVVLGGTTEPTAELEDALFEAGCDDATLSFRNSVPFLEFDREEADFQSAVISAIRDISRAGQKLTVRTIEPADFVSQSEIARRSGISRESARQLFCGERGKGGFPAPISGITSSTLLWSWRDVSWWMYRHEKIKNFDFIREAEFIREYNRIAHTFNFDCDRNGRKKQKQLNAVELKSFRDLIAHSDINPLQASVSLAYSCWLANSVSKEILFDNFRPALESLFRNLSFKISSRYYANDLISTWHSARSYFHSGRGSNLIADLIAQVDDLLASFDKNLSNLPQEQSIELAEVAVICSEINTLDGALKVLSEIHE